jgi:secretion/DNA translocation related TadE-like protein
VNRFDARSDGGAGSILVLAMTALIVLLGSAVITLMAAMARHERLQAAADTAAAGAVAAMLSGVIDPCGVSARGVEVQGFRQVRCSIQGDEVEVVVDEPQASPLLSRPAYARAGAVEVSSP